jgi:hypothetical protein
VISLLAKIIDLLIGIAAAREQRKREERAAAEAYERALRSELEAAARRKSKDLN